MRIIIIGNGVAGIEAALTLSEIEPGLDITIVSEESDHFFSRTALMWVAAGQLSYQCIEPYARDLYEQNKWKRERARATHVQAAQGNNPGQVTLSTGKTLAFDRLLIACGSRPRSGPWPGSDLLGVGHFVTLQDLQWLEHEVHGRSSARGPLSRPDHHLAQADSHSAYAARASRYEARGGPPAHPCVIGGGLIGIEAVEVFHTAGLKPRFFIREEWFWPMAINAAESSWIAERMRAHGVEVHLGENVEAMLGETGVEKVRTDKDEYEQDVVVVAIGVVPNTQWLEHSDVARDPRGGLVVDEQLRTNATGVYAAGDCASVTWFDGRQGPEQLWYTGKSQGRIAARAMLGEDVEYKRGHWFNSAKLFDIEYTTAGLVGMKQPDEAEWVHEETGDVRSSSRIVVSGDKVIGFNMLGRRWDHEVLLDFIAQERGLEYVLQHLSEAAYDTEFVPPLVLPQESFSTRPSPSR